MASSAPAATALGRNGPGYRTRPSSVWIEQASTWDLPSPPNSAGIVHPDRPSSPASSGMQPGVVARLAVQHAAQLGGGPLVGQERAQRLGLGSVILAEVDRVPRSP